MEADLVLIDGKVITVDKDFIIQQAVATKDGKIVYDKSRKNEKSSPRDQ